jgi:hypothetical protein
MKRQGGVKPQLFPSQQKRSNSQMQNRDRFDQIDFRLDRLVGAVLTLAEAVNIPHLLSAQDPRS